ncbi:MAG: TolC family protein [Deltaproteobacteria bacterium]|nr:TolC family protein [Deltaproteobacteria bacterium]
MLAAWGLWLVLVPGFVSQAGASGLPPDLQALVNEALQANAEIKQMRGQFTATRETIRLAGALDDPEVAFSMKDIPTDNWAFNREPMTQKMLELSQKFPFPGKRRLRSEVAGEQAHSDEYVYKDKVNEIRAKVVIAYWGLSLAQTNFNLTQKNKQVWEQVVQVAETRYSVGQGMQADVLQAQVELGNYLDRLFQWTQKQESSRADINALRSKPPQTPVSRAQTLKPRPFSLKLDELLAQAETRPQLQALKFIIAKQEKAVDLARKDYFPDARISVGYGFRETLAPPINQKQADMFTGSVMFNVPIWVGSKIRPKIREEQAKQGAAKDAHQSALNQLEAAIKDRHAKLERLAKQVSLFDQGIIPQARQAVGAALASYQVGALPFNQLYQNQIAVYNAEMQLEEYLKDFEENWAELEWLVGQELPRPAGGKP